MTINIIYDNYYEIYYTKTWIIHRDNDLPAVRSYCGELQWYQNGQLHRDNDRPAIIYHNGNKKWYQNGQLHRDNDNPAIEEINSKRWYQKGQLHRDNGKPSIICFANGHVLRMRWYYHGCECSTTFPVYIPLRYFPEFDNKIE